MSRAHILPTMEVLGAVASGLTLAALFKHTLHVWELIQLYRTCDTDFDKLRLQFELEKCRLYNWGSEMGLCADGSDMRPNILQGWRSEALINSCLRQIIDLLSDAQRIKAKYGGIDVASSMAETQLLDAHGSGNSSGRGPSEDPACQLSKSAKSQLRKTSWIIRDRKKFIILIVEVRGLIDALQGITNGLLNTTRLEETLSRRINQILDPYALRAIASVWKTSHPSVASAASTAAQSVSLQSDCEKEDICEWRSHVDTESSDSQSMADLEDLGITELKHTAFKRMRENMTLTTNLERTLNDKEKLEALLLYQEFYSTWRRIMTFAMPALHLTGFLPYWRNLVCSSCSVTCSGLQLIACSHLAMNPQETAWIN